MAVNNFMHKGKFMLLQVRRRFLPLPFLIGNMKCLIIDNHNGTQQELKKKLTDNYQAEVHCMLHPYEIKKTLREIPIDMLFIKLSCWHFSLFEGLPVIPPVCFLQHGSERVQIQQIVTVLRSPFQNNSIRRVCLHLQKETFQNPHYLFVKANRQWHRVFWEEIELVERIFGGYIRLYTRTMDYWIPGSIPAFMEHLPSSHFERLADNIILPKALMPVGQPPCYHYKGRDIILSYRFQKSRKNLSDIEDGLWH